MLLCSEKGQAHFGALLMATNGASLLGDMTETVGNKGL